MRPPTVVPRVPAHEPVELADLQFLVVVEHHYMPMMLDSYVTRFSNIPVAAVVKSALLLEEAAVESALLLEAKLVKSAYYPEEEEGAYHLTRGEVKLVELPVQSLHLQDPSIAEVCVLEFVGHQPHDKGNPPPSVARRE